MRAPYSFDEFFSSNREESVSPFLTQSSRKWGKNLLLRSSFAAGAFLAIAYFLSFFSPTGSILALTAAYFIVGTPALINCLKDVSRWDINIDVLMTLAALLSVLIGSGFEGALLLVLFELSAAMETAVMQKTRSTVLNLHKLSPRFAWVEQAGGHLIEKPVRHIEVGELILVRAGDVVPLDGVVIQGSSYVNLVHLTGESAPVPKGEGSDVPAGAGNLDGSLLLRVVRSSRDSTLSRIIELITQAQETKPQATQFLDRFGGVYATSIIGLSALFALLISPIWGIPYLGPDGGIYRALAFLIAASPCALILATPTAYLSALNSCARQGILPKGGIVLDAVMRCHTVAFDKTGTLTTGELTCIKQMQIHGPVVDPAKALLFAASLERNAVHPIAKAVVDEAQKQQISLCRADQFRSIPGYGLEGIIEGELAAIGHHDFIQTKLGTSFELPVIEGITTYLWIQGKVIMFMFQDTLRPNVKRSLANLKKQNLHLVMLTGDHPINANPIAKEVGIDDVYANLRPEDKLQKVTQFSKEHGLMMVGDGMNDAPALTKATVGISMGKIGSATAVDASDVVLIHDDLTLIPWLVQKARQTRRILIQNLTLALTVIICATTPAFLGLVPLWVAVILHEGGTVLVGLNSLRLLRR